MGKKRTVLALMLSAILHILLPAAETIAEQHGRKVEMFDRVASWPAWLCSVLLPPGHGIPQLVLPLIFSLAFYAAVFWIVILVYERLRKGAGPGAGGAPLTR